MKEFCDVEADGSLEKILEIGGFLRLMLDSASQPTRRWSMVPWTNRVHVFLRV